MASSEGKEGGEPSSALFSKFGGSIFGAAAKGSPQKVVTNIRGFISDRISGSIPDQGKLSIQLLIHSHEKKNYRDRNEN